MTETILILDCNIVKDPSFLQRNGYVLVKNGTVAAVGPMSEITSHDADRVIDGRDTLVIPGLINSHTHSPMTLFRGMADDLELHDWLHNHIFPAEMSHVNEEMVYWCSKLAAAEMILSGTTCVADGYFYSHQTAKAFDEAGLRAVVAHGILDFPAPGVADPTKNIDTVAKFITDWKDESDLITPAVFVHSPYTCSAATLQKAKKLADHQGVRFFIHIAETKEEQQVIQSPNGSTPVQHLHNLGILDNNCVLVHAIWLNDDDLDILASSEAHVVLCPQSNYKLASGRSRALDMANRNIAFGLGTDSCASNNSLDMFREMDIFAKSQKVFHNDPTIFPAELVFRAATTHNNAILGYPTEIAISPGSRADLVQIDLKTPHLTPFYNQDLLVYSIRGNDVQTVIINGKIIVDNKQIKTFDVDTVKQEVMQLAQRLKKHEQ